jgi:hypothetical protein
MIRNTLANVRLTENHIYRYGSLLLEASYRRGWRLMVVTEDGNHVPRADGALIGYRMRDDGLWDTVYDHATKRLFGWKRWSVAYGEPRAIDLGKLSLFATSRSMVKDVFQQREVDRRFREIMAAMEW